MARPPFPQLPPEALTRADAVIAAKRAREGTAQFQQYRELLFRALLTPSHADQHDAPDRGAA